MLGLSGSDHTKRLEELQQNRMVEAADTVSADTKLVALPIDGGTLTLAQADEKKIADEEGKILIAAQTLTDVDGEDGVRMLLALIESAEEVHVQSAYLVGFDADGKQMESAAEASVSPVLLADRQSVVIAEIEPHAMDGAERFELRLNIEREPKCAAEEQDADAELRDHYFVATLTEDAEDGEEANGYVSIWATDAEGTLLDGFNASLAEGEQLLAGETWTFEKRIGSWVTPEPGGHHRDGLGGISADQINGLNRGKTVNGFSRETDFSNSLQGLPVFRKREDGIKNTMKRGKEDEKADFCGPAMRHGLRLRAGRGRHGFERRFIPKKP